MALLCTDYLFHLLRFRQPPRPPLAHFPSDACPSTGGITGIESTDGGAEQPTGQCDGTGCSMVGSASDYCITETVEGDEACSETNEAPPCRVGKRGACMGAEGGAAQAHPCILGCGDDVSLLASAQGIRVAAVCVVDVHGVSFPPPPSLASWCRCAAGDAPAPAPAPAPDAAPAATVAAAVAVPTAPMTAPVAEPVSPLA